MDCALAGCQLHAVAANATTTILPQPDSSTGSDFTLLPPWRVFFLHLDMFDHLVVTGRNFRAKLTNRLKRCTSFRVTTHLCDLRGVPGRRTTSAAPGQVPLSTDGSLISRTTLLSVKDTLAEYPAPPR